MARPVCRKCSKPIPKLTESIDFWHNREDAPRSKAEAEQRTNLQVTAVRYWPGGKMRSMYVWNGESYAFCFRHFCSTDCAAMFGMLMADKGA
jgi:hypothetical protein